MQKQDKARHWRRPWDGAASQLGRESVTRHHPVHHDRRHVDEFMGVSASGTAIAWPGITILHARGDRVIERFSPADMLGLLDPAAGLIRRAVGMGERSACRP